MGYYIKTEHHKAVVDLFDLAKEFVIVITIKQFDGDEKVTADVHVAHPESGFETSRSIRASNIIEISRKAEIEAAGIKRAIAAMERAGRLVVP